ncbi:MAG: (2Fe-2S)-binding protein [Spongiibacteraceae bacterium]|nr:(2Fe-2S)-binding protein [Spongiibacteraceae bacterium]
MTKTLDKIPFGWYQVAYSHELVAGDSRGIRYFGKELVLFRTQSGEAHVLDAYCPHLGAHLGHGIHEFAGRGGEVRDESIVCPFHGWRFGGDGMCVEVPYAKNMPPKVKDQQCLKSWPVREMNQVIYVWYHPHDIEPLYEVDPIPEASADNDEWGELDIHQWVINTHPQEMAENGVDVAHFRYVHQTASFPDAEISFDGINRTSISRAKMQTPRGEVDGAITSWGRGVGNGAVRFTGICETVLLGNTTPIELNKCQVNFAFIQKKVNGETPKGGVSAAIVADICKQLNEDKPIWENKIFRDQPVLCDNDGPISKFRKWYAQFYV